MFPPGPHGYGRMDPWMGGMHAPNMYPPMMGMPLNPMVSYPSLAHPSLVQILILHSFVL